jgi:hypothetical protein
MFLLYGDRRWTVSSTVQQRPAAPTWILAAALDLGVALVMAVNLWLLAIQEQLFAGDGRGDGPKHGAYEAIPLEDR